MDGQVWQIVFYLVAMGVWVLFRLLRSGGLEKWRKARSKKKQESSADRGSRKPKSFSTRSRDQDIPSSSERDSTSKGAKGGKSQNGELHPEWKAVDDALAEIVEEAEDLAIELKKSPETARLVPWLQEAIIERAEKTAHDLKSSGAVDRRRLRKAQARRKLYRYRWFVFEQLALEREDRGESLMILDELAEGLFRPLVGRTIGEKTRFRGFWSLGPSVDENMRQTLLEIGVIPIEAPVGWPNAMDNWPDGFRTMVSDVIFSRQGLLTEAYKRTGLSGFWPVPYSEPVYVNTNEVLGPFGSWLPGIFADLASILLLGPAWAEAMVVQLIEQTDDVRDSLSMPTSSSGWHLASLPAPSFRVEILARTLETLRYKKTAKRIRKIWQEEFGECETLYMPTRRRSYYGVGAAPYLEAGHGLVGFLLEGNWESLDGRTLRDFSPFKRQEVSPEAVDALVASALAGRPVVGTMRLRVAVALAAHVREPQAYRRIVRAALFGLGPHASDEVFDAKAGGLAAVSRLGPLDVSPDVLVEAVILQTILQPKYPPRRQ